jgi:hypothetical protein
VSPSTISRDIAAAIYLPREKASQRSSPTTTELLAVLSQLGYSLSALECECEGSLEEPRHSLCYTLRFVGETLDLVEEGRLEEVTPEDVASLKRIRGW